MNFSIKTIPHFAQRYDTVGDYWFKHLMQIEIRVSDFSEAIAQNFDASIIHGINGEDINLAEKYEFLVALHEFIEAFLCYQEKVPYGDIDTFDLAHLDSDEPGALPEAPYHKQHMIATDIEQKMAAHLGVDWTGYENAVQKLSKAKATEQEKASTS